MARGQKPASVQDVLNRTWDNTRDMIRVTVSGAGTAFNAGQKANINGTAGTLNTTVPCTEALIQASPDNGTLVINIGDATSQPFQLAAGATVSIPVQDINLIYIKVSTAGTGTGTANWLAIGG